MADTKDSFVLQTPSGGMFISPNAQDLIKVLQIEFNKTSIKQEKQNETINNSCSINNFVNGSIGTM